MSTPTHVWRDRSPIWGTGGLGHALYGVVETTVHPRCQAPDCGRYVPDTRQAGSQYCSRKCKQRANYVKGRS